MNILSKLSALFNSPQAKNSERNSVVVNITFDDLINHPDLPKDIHSKKISPKAVLDSLLSEDVNKHLPHEYKSLVNNLRENHKEIHIAMKINPGKSVDILVLDKRLFKEDATGKDLKQGLRKIHLKEGDSVMNIIHSIKLQNEIYIYDKEEKITQCISYEKLLNKVRVIDDYQKCEIVAGIYVNMHQLLDDYPSALHIMEKKTNSGEMYFEFINPQKKTIQEPSLTYARFLSKSIQQSETVTQVKTSIKQRVLAIKQKKF